MIPSFVRVSILTALIVLSFIGNSLAQSASSQWKITSVKICKLASGRISPNIETLGSFPVYSFFIPRPVWTVNGNVVDAQPNYEKGRLSSFMLVDAAQFLKSGIKNTIKFSLPDQNASKVFFYDDAKINSADCYEMF